MEKKQLELENNIKLPLVSVLIISYNQQEFILDCLESVLKQTYENLELVICDDCSNDSTYQLEQRWCEQNASVFSNYTCTRNVFNRGLVGNCNVAIQKAHGEYIKLLAADDMLLPEAISEMVQYLVHNPQFIGACTNAILIQKSTKYAKLERENYEVFYKKPPYFGKNLFHRLCRYNYVVAPTVLLRKKAYDKYGLFDGELKFEDWEYWLRLTSSGERLGYINQSLVAYRIMDESLSHFTEGQLGESKYELFFREEEKIVHKYSNESKSTIDFFYNKALLYAINMGYSRMVRIIAEKRFHISPKTILRIMVGKIDNPVELSEILQIHKKSRTDEY